MLFFIIHSLSCWWLFVIQLIFSPEMMCSLLTSFTLILPLRIRCRIGDVSSDRRAGQNIERRHITMYGSLDGSCGYILPVSERTYRRFSMVYNLLVQHLPHIAGMENFMLQSSNVLFILKERAFLFCLSFRWLPFHILVTKNSNKLFVEGGRGWMS